MPKFLPAPIRAIQRVIGDAHESFRRTQSRPQSGVATTAPTIQDAPNVAPGLPEALSGADQDLRQCAWNGSIGDGILHRIHRERLDTVTATRTAHAVRFSALSNRLAALEAELSVLVEQPPKPAPQPTVLNIGPTRKGA